MGLTDIVPAPYRWLVMVAAFAVTFTAGGIAGFRVEEDHRDARDAKHAQQQLQDQIAARDRTLTEEHRRQDAVQGIANEAHQQAEHYQALADSNRAAGQQLREQLAGAQRAGAACPAAAAGSAPAGASPDLLADVQRRLEEAEDGTVEFADASRRAGLACERIQDALTQHSQ